MIDRSPTLFLSLRVLHMTKLYTIGLSLLRPTFHPRDNRTMILILHLGGRPSILLRLRVYVGLRSFLRNDFDILGILVLLRI